MEGLGRVGGGERQAWDSLAATLQVKFCPGNEIALPGQMDPAAS